MDIDAFVVDVSELVEICGRRNGQRWTVDTGDLRAIIERHLLPAPEDTETTAAAPAIQVDLYMGDGGDDG